MTKKESPRERGAAPLRLDARFLTSAPDLAHSPRPNGPEVAFAGRSNAGKSSVLNQVTGNRQLAKVSKTPGRTQLLNFFELQSGGRLVDLPGYGYAQAGKARQAQWQRAVNEFLSLREPLVGLVLVMDIRRPDQLLDQELIQWAHASELPVRVLLNKADKLGYGAQQRAVAQVREAHAAQTLVSVQTFSALRGTGRTELIETLLEWTRA